MTPAIAKTWPDHDWLETGQFSVVSARDYDLNKDERSARCKRVRITRWEEVGPIVLDAQPGASTTLMRNKGGIGPLYIVFRWSKERDAHDVSLE